MIALTSCKSNQTRNSTENSANAKTSTESIQPFWSRFETAKPINFRKGALLPKAYSLFKASNQQLKTNLSQAPNEALVNLKDSKTFFQLPGDSKGALVAFRIVENNIMDSVLASKFPMIKSYSGYKSDDQLVTLRCEINDNGLFAMITYTDETYYLEPVTITEEDGIYILFKKSDIDTRDREYPER